MKQKLTIVLVSTTAFTIGAFMLNHIKILLYGSTPIREKMGRSIYIRKLMKCYYYNI